VTDIAPGVTEDWTATVACLCWAGKRAAGLVFCPEHHIYWFGGQRVPSVTGILRGLDSYVHVDADVLEAARQRGIAVHSATQFDDDGELDMNTVDDMIRPYLFAWRSFRKESGFEPLHQEGRVYSPKYRYAGTYDVIGFMGGKRVLIDKKSGDQVPLAAGPQTAAYAAAYEEAGGDRIQKRYVVQLRSNGDYQLIPYGASDDLQCFLAHLQIHRWREAHA